VTVIRTRLSSLDTKIVELQDNIPELNVFIKTQTQGLEARGEKTDDLLVNLFKAYKACGDEEFVGWVKFKENAYNEGAPLTPIELMSLADNKYKTQFESGQWMQTTKSQKRIVALTAQVTSLSAKKPDGKMPYNKGKYQPKVKGFDKKKKGGKGSDKDYQWTKVGPMAGQPTKKDVNGKHFRWCTYHDDKGSGGKWVTHTLAACKVRLELEAKGKLPQAHADAARGGGKMKVAAMVAVIPEDWEEDDY
jgi:hypothetical protein